MQMRGSATQCHLKSMDETGSLTNAENHAEYKMYSHGSGAFRDPKITDKFDIFVKTLSGKTVVVETAKCESVTMLMKSAANKSGMPIDHQVLISQGKSFERGKMIKDYNTQKDSTVHMTTLLRGGVQGQDFDVPPAMDYHQIVNTLNQWSGLLKQLTADNEKLKNDTGIALLYRRQSGNLDNQSGNHLAACAT